MLNQIVSQGTAPCNSPSPHNFPDAPESASVVQPHTRLNHDWLKKWGPKIGRYMHVFIALWQHAGLKRNHFFECWPPVELLSVESGCSVATVERALALFNQLGLIVTYPRFYKRGGQTDNGYRFLVAPYTPYASYASPESLPHAPQGNLLPPPPIKPTHPPVSDCAPQRTITTKPQVLNHVSMSDDFKTSFPSDAASRPAQPKLSQQERERLIAILERHRFEPGRAAQLVRKHGPKVGDVPAWWAAQDQGAIDVPQAAITAFLSGTIKNPRKKPEPAVQNAPCRELHVPERFKAPTTPDPDAWQDECVEAPPKFNPSIYVPSLLDRLEDGLPVERLDSYRSNLLELDEWLQVKAMVLAKWESRANLT